MCIWEEVIRLCGVRMVGLIQRIQVAGWRGVEDVHLAALSLLQPVAHCSCNLVTLAVNVGGQHAGRG